MTRTVSRLARGLLTGLARQVEAANRTIDAVLARLVPQAEAAARCCAVECRCQGGVNAEACTTKIGLYCRRLGTSDPWVFKRCCTA